MSGERKATSAPGGARGSRSRKQPSKSLGKRILKWGLIAGFVGLLLGVAAFAYGYAATDIPDPNEDFQTQTTFVYYADGKTELGQFATQNRQNIPLSEVPQHVQDAVIAAENRTFWTDQGLDPKGIIRAAFSNATSGSTQGASTITQQYVKVLYLSQERTITRKVKEAFLTMKIHQQQSKEQILQGYLNTIYFGRGAYGVQAAAQAYFAKDAKDLNVREAAVLASVLNAPSYFDPAEGKDARKRLEGRYRYVLGGMADMGAISEDTAERAKRKLPKFPEIQVEDRYGGPRGHLLMLVKQELRKEGFSDAEIEGGGLHVTTTFSRKMQRAAEQAVRQERPKENAKGVNIGLAAVEPGTGQLKAMYGGRDYVKNQRNWAMTGRQPGSTFKPFALAAGLMDGFSLFDTFTGETYEFDDGVKVNNEGGKDYGDVDLLEATEKSINTAYVDLTVQMKKGPQKVIDAAIAAGIPESAPGLKPDPTITLGTADIRPVDLATAYATLANEGRRNDWFVIKKVTRGNGEEIYRHKNDEERAFPEDVTSNVVYAQQQVVKSGTGTAARELGCPAAGKTGTANLRPSKPGVTSAWFSGYTPNLAASVMYVRGASGTRNLDGVGGLADFYGGAYPARTWTAFMEKALEGQECEPFPKVDYVNGSPPPSPSPSPTESPSEEPTEESPSPTETKTPGPPETPPGQVSESPSPTDSPTDPGGPPTHCNGPLCVSPDPDSSNESASPDGTYDGGSG